MSDHFQKYEFGSVYSATVHCASIAVVSWIFGLFCSPCITKGSLLSHAWPGTQMNIWTGCGNPSLFNFSRCISPFHFVFEIKAKLYERSVLSVLISPFEKVFETVSFKTIFHSKKKKISFCGKYTLILSQASCRQDFFYKKTFRGASLPLPLLAIWTQVLRQMGSFIQLHVNNVGVRCVGIKLCECGNVKKPSACPVAANWGRVRMEGVSLLCSHLTTFHCDGLCRPADVVSGSYPKKSWETNVKTWTGWCIRTDQPT